MSTNPPDGETTTAAVSVLQAELNLVNGNLDGLERKTAILLFSKGDLGSPPAAPDREG